MTTDRHAAAGAPAAIRARYAALRHIAGGASQYPPERAAAAELVKRLAKQYPALAAEPARGEDDPVYDLASDDIWAWGHFDVPGTAGLGRTRTEALTEIIRAHAVDTVQVAWRHPNSETRLSYYGIRPIIDHLTVTLPDILAELDAAALAATRRYRLWMRERDDTMPTWYAGMCRHWRRDYLAAAGAAYARQLREAAHPPMLTATSHQPTDPTMGHYSASEVAGHDALLLDRAPLQAAHAVITAAHRAVRSANRRALDSTARPQLTRGLSRFTIGV